MSDENIQPGQESARPGKTWTAVIFVTVIAIILLGLMVYWLKPSVDRTRDFKEPKLTSAFLDGEPFMRLQLAPGDQYRPIEVMKGTNVRLECFAVKTESTSLRFVVNAFGKTFEKTDCVFDIDVTDEIGQFSDVKIEYFDGASKKIDHLEIPIVVVAKNERVEFHQLQDIEHQAVQAGGVPDRIYIYGRAIANLPGDSSEYGALFFVADPANDVPIVQMMPLLQGDQPKPMIGRMVRYRSYGKDLAGYAMWTPEAVNISPLNRTITDLYIGVFKLADIDAIFKKLLKVQVTGADTVTVTPLVRSPYEVMEMTVNGRLLSESFHVVTGAKRAVIDERVKTVITQPAAPEGATPDAGSPQAAPEAGTPQAAPQAGAPQAAPAAPAGTVLIHQN